MSGIRFFKIYRFFIIHGFWKPGAYMLLGVLIGFYPWLAGQQQDQAVIWSAILVGAFVFGLAWLELIAQWWKIRGIAGKGAGILLVRRMAALDLDPCELRLLDPALMRHMQRQCTVCDEREYCLQDLTSGSALQDREDWRDYCPNAFALEMLSGLQSRAKEREFYSHGKGKTTTRTPHSLSEFARTMLRAVLASPGTASGFGADETGMTCPLYGTAAQGGKLCKEFRCDECGYAKAKST